MMIENSFTIIKMTAKNIDGLVKIENECFSKPWTQSGFENELKNDTANFHVALCNNQEEAYMGYYIILDEGYVANIAVLPEYRRRGIAGALIENALTQCREKKLLFLSLEVRKGNENAVRLYKKYGFETVGERKNFYSAPVENALIMTKYFNCD